MSTKHITHLISEYIDGEISVDNKDLVEIHLKECKTCRLQLEETRGMLRWIKNVPEPKARAGLENRVRQRLVNSPSHEKQSWFQRPFLTGGLAAVMACGLLVFMVRDQWWPMNKVQRQIAGDPQPVSEQEAAEKISVDLLSVKKTQKAEAKQDVRLDSIKKEISGEIKDEGQLRGNSLAPPAKKIVGSGALKVNAPKPSSDIPALESRLREEDSDSKDSDILGDKERVGAKSGAVGGALKAKSSESLVRRSVGNEFGNAQVKSEPPNQEWIGTNGNIETPVTKVIRTQSEWQQLWRYNFSSQEEQMPLPSIDFSKDMVVAVFIGKKPSAGYSVKITGWQKTSRDNEPILMVQYKTTAPVEDILSAAVLTQPYHIKVIPRFDGLVEFIQK